MMLISCTKKAPELMEIAQASLDQNQEDQAIDNLNWISNHIYSNPAIHYYFGDLQGDKWTKNEITLTNNPLT